MFEWAFNSAWLAAQWPAHRHFLSALKRPAATQKSILTSLITKNQECVYGRTHSFKRIHSVRDFQSAVPIVSYDELAPWIEKIKRGEQNVLTTDPVLMLEKSSGSAAAAKYIPYTRSLRREFQNALAAWIYDLYANDPQLLRGRSYWVITPLARERERTSGGLAVGFENDSEYFGGFQRYLLDRLMAVPAGVAHAREIESSLYITLRFLLQTPSLAFISAWNPSLLLILLDKLEHHGERLVYDLERGTVDLPDELPAPIALQLRSLARQELRQADILRAMLRHGIIEPLRLWPNLRLISCWTSAAAQPLVPEIYQRFPGVQVQGKGLLATEGVITIPLHRRHGCIPACTSHFLEFAEDSSLYPKLLHELELGREYSVLITTGGGLWRYRLGDRVRVLHIKNGVPVMEFIGKEDGICDLRGEKLSPVFVANVLKSLRERGALTGRFAMLAPSAAGDHYVLFTDSPHMDLEALDRLLCANPHYAYCRKLGQLTAPMLFKISTAAEETYIHQCEARGQRVGNIKPSSLDQHAGWEQIFRGEFITSVEPGSPSRAGFARDGVNSGPPLRADFARNGVREVMA